MATIGSQQALYTLLRSYQNELRGELGGLASRLSDTLLLAADSDGRVMPSRQSEVRVELGSLVDEFFTGTVPGRRGRHPFGSDGVTPLAPYPKLLTRYIVRAIETVVEVHHAYLKRVVPADLQTALSQRYRRLSEQGPNDDLGDLFGGLRPPVGPSASGHGVSGVSANRRAIIERNKNLRLFQPNPLANYEPPHTWVDPNGYRLSDRIWQTNAAVRGRIDRFVASGINRGVSARDLSRAVEQFVQPGRQGVLTTKPYPAYRGKTEYLSYDAMRLGRTEITRAHGAAALASARANPYVGMMDFRLSARHPKQDICDDLAANGPYPTDRCPVPAQDSHPLCLCTLIPRVSRPPSQVTAELRETLLAAEQENLQPFMTPLQIDAFKSALLGEALWRLILRAGQDLAGAA